MKKLKIYNGLCRPLVTALEIKLLRYISKIATMSWLPPCPLSLHQNRLEMEGLAKITELGDSLPLTVATYPRQPHH